DEIVEAFPFFPTLHCIFSACLNITPIPITMGVGPHRKKTVHFQALSDDKSNPPASMPEQHSQMLVYTRFSRLNKPVTNPPWHDWDKENIPLSQPQPTPPLLQSAATPEKHPSKLLSITESIEKAKECISKLPKKCSVTLDTLIDLQQANLNAINSQADAEMHMQECQMLLKEYEAGVWNASEYKEKLGELMARPAKHSHQAAGGD
ncbi:hypothetical protein PAXRUDRAFT_139683, partial [Paxillus rubicundulus Ve08.2h10]